MVHAVRLGRAGVERPGNHARLPAAERRLPDYHLHHHAADRRLSRIAGSENQLAKTRWLPALVAGQTFATVGISHLTTSRRHLAKPVLAARPAGSGFILDGYSPWVTGACHADVIVTGATLADGRQILVALPTDAKGVSVPPPAQLVGISASHTGEVRLDGVQIEPDWLLAGPAENVMRMGIGAGTGGLQTSTLAIGLASAALAYLEHEQTARPELAQATAELRREHAAIETRLLALAAGQTVCSNDQLRSEANSIALRTSQAGSPPPKAPVTSSATPPAAGVVKRSSSSSGAARPE